ncbi:hydantoinase [Metarhizium robertsii ARSEF 23]|uniref:Hydantoinase n=1 Tax=Metarhizium robertsii (strain ARSEF 23 / ATCC MYA-3075) TaxID=655844 RepID=E9F9U0_METRA|nr:hydantoinase [Metarhizium robertsii ARSEF 23]EFY95440.2 hydantoinase [Metarhizium robertsii ARSEF 23]
MAFYRVGVDVGGTNTDAAILDISACDTASRGVLASYKTFTTTDITSGIETAVKAILEASQVDLNRIIAVTIGTTHFINAVVEANARELSRVAVLRLCGPFTRQISPFADFPPKLRSILDGGSFFLDGGLEFNGEQILPLDYEQIRQATRHLIHQGVRSAAIVGVFSPIDHVSPQEETCRKIMLEVDSDLDITISRDIGPVGLLERENATILNSAILRTARRLIKGFKRAIAVLGLQCPLYLSRNDGTIIAADEASNLPITTFASGPTNSMIGAAFLAGYGRRSVSTNNHAKGVKTNGDSSESQVLVVDIGGTTTDVCALLPSGFPRLAPGFTEVGGVRTAFSMPEVRSVGLGGGSIVQVDAETEHVTLGPASVGNLLTQQALVFGGRTMTATDIVAAMGKTELGHPSLVSEIPAIVVEAARKRIKKILEDVIEQMKFSAAPVHVLLVGGGALLVTESLEGVERCIRPMHSEAANAVGAAISEVSGDVDLIEALKGRSEKALVAAACEKAIGLAIERGATADDVRIVQITKTPLQYVNNGAIRIQVRAVGKLRTPDVVRLPETNGTGSAEDDNEPEARPQVEPDIAVDVPHQLQVGMDLATYRPEVKQGVWYVSEVDIELISTGCGILGTGGGGPTHYEALRCKEILRTGGKGRMRIICPESLKDNDLIGFGSWYGAPGVSNERIVNGGEIDVGVDTLLKVLGGQKLNGFLLDEVGGGNGLSIFSTAVNYNLPVVDGDTMGRAFPAMYHSTTSVYGHPLTPCCITDCRGVISILMGADSPDRVEKVLRSTAIELGLGCAVCTNPLSGKSIKSHAVPRTLSLAWYLGRAIHLARRKKTSYIEAVSHIGKARLIFAGKIIDVQRNISDGYTKGHVLLAPLSLEEQEGVKTDSHSNRQADKHMLIPFQNEYLYAALTDPTGKEADQIICTVPELISVLGQDGEAIGSQDLKYGLRVSVIAMPAHPLWKTPQGLRVGGPQGFGLEIPFVSIGEQPVNPSVIEEFSN